MTHCINCDANVYAHPLSSLNPLQEYRISPVVLQIGRNRWIAEMNALDLLGTCLGQK